MIKCPHCGSTAQLEMVWRDTENYASTLYTEYECGCGCSFRIDFIASTPQILKIKPKENNKGHIHCPANGYDCPYWKDGICGLYSAEENWADPWEECSDFGMFWDKGDDYIDYD